ncbi:DUF4097 domain-containing protein [Streptomyces sp. NPDC008313]|uniref:DUF4097 family beta strand repeat-containing protein n=1 Tax=Streptomyces sp. NPDC008313 TaxID=3364826 RepID=UPI0036EAB14D
MYEFTANGPATAQVRVPGGHCSVRAGQGPGVGVRVAPAASWRSGDRKAAENTAVAFEGGVLTVTTDRGSVLSKPRVRVEVVLPPGSAVEFDSDAADLEVHGPVAALTADSESGGVKADQVTGDVRLDLSSGDAVLGKVGGCVTFVTSSGAVRVDHVAGRVAGTSSSGDLRFGVAEGDVLVKTNSGDVRIATACGGTVSATTSSGDVTIGVEEGVGVRPSLSTNSGDRRGELVEGARAGASGVEVSLDVKTSSGDITLRRA